MFQGSLRQFQTRFKEVSRGFKESVKCVSRKFKKFQGCFKNLSMNLIELISSQLPELFFSGLSLIAPLIVKGLEFQNLCPNRLLKSIGQIAPHAVEGPADQQTPCEIGLNPM